MNQLPLTRRVHIVKAPVNTVTKLGKTWELPVRVKLRRYSNFTTPRPFKKYNTSLAHQKGR